MKKLPVLFVVLSVGCTSVPISGKFPEVPDTLRVKCPSLEKINEGAKLSDITKNISGNYTTYYECAIKNDAWNEWYDTQKKIFESIK